jgi:hypothetical protein
MAEVLILVLVLAVVLAVIWHLPIPHPWKNILLLVVAAIGLIYLIRMLLGAGAVDLPD